MIRSNEDINLIDFGFSEIIKNDHKDQIKCCGTPYYIPPEFVDKSTPHGIYFDF
jgi:serine/threonine protein kinase